jgi:hypothetical protein
MLPSTESSQVQVRVAERIDALAVTVSNRPPVSHPRQVLDCTDTTASLCAVVIISATTTNSKVRRYISREIFCASVLVKFFVRVI